MREYIKRDKDHIEKLLFEFSMPSNPIDETFYSLTLQHDLLLLNNKSTTLQSI